jgi:hypothetical protein
MHAEYELTCRRLGTQPPADVLAFADRMAGDRERRLLRRVLSPRPTPLGRERDLWLRAG